MEGDSVEAGDWDEDPALSDLTMLKHGVNAEVGDVIDAYH